MARAAALSVTERAHLADLLREVGPQAPTLCDGWSTTDLVAHLVARERRPDSAPGFVLRPLARHSENVRASFSDRPYVELVELVRTGPPKWSPFAVPKLEPLVNTAEFFVHHEDVRRAQTGWAPRSLPRAAQDELWQALVVRAKIAFRAIRCGVVLQRSDVGATDTAGDTAVTAKAGRPAAVVTGHPQELLLFTYGRRSHAHVKITGPDEARSLLATFSLDS